MQQAPDIKKAQRSWERLKRTPAVMTHLSEDDRASAQLDIDEVSVLTSDTLQSQKLKKLNDDMLKLRAAKLKNDALLSGGELAGRKKDKKSQTTRTSHSLTIEQSHTSSTESGQQHVHVRADDTSDSVSLLGSEGSAFQGGGPCPEERGHDVGGADVAGESDSMRGCGVLRDDEETSALDSEPYSMEQAENEFKSCGSSDDSDFDDVSDDSDDNQSSYTADQSMSRNLPELKMRTRHEHDDYDDDEEDDDPLYLPTYASDFGTPRPWSLLPEEEKRKITGRAERRNKGLDLYAVKHSVAHGGSEMSSAASSSRSGRGNVRTDLLVATNRSDQSDYEEGWEKANARIALLRTMNSSPLKGSEDEALGVVDGGGGADEEIGD